jgi:hypothetical protein
MVMKVVAYILVLAMGMLGMNRFTIGTEMHAHETEQTCCADPCADKGECDQEEDGKGHAHACPYNCDCSCCYHIMAISYQFIAIPLATVQSYHYGFYHNDYQFEFHTPLFEPPRIG